MIRAKEERHSGSSKKSRTQSPVKSSHKSRESSVSSKTEFEIMLGMNDQIITSNKKSSKTKRESKSPKSRKSDSFHESLNESFDRNDYKNHKEIKKEKCYVKSERIEDSPSKSRPLFNGMPKELETKPSFKELDASDILSSLPTANYKPLHRDLIEERLEANRRKMQKANEDLSYNVQSKKGRTAVFAGNARAKTYTHVPRLEELCLQVLMDNYDKLCYLGYAPYYLLKPVLQKCNPKQLVKIEKYNPVCDLSLHFCGF